MHPYDYDSMSVVEAERVMMEYDSNSDGTVSMNEYLDNPQFKDSKLIQAAYMSAPDKIISSRAIYVN